ncbi:hypothetical protein SAMD00019534_020340 [Acytostelium subglobosum LB1]|uniref:hypothetical protein n=1 Tax=Acytostelium subglobosum LB1 TaxID=1410327 RepID=UPI000644A98E|nr:hypothetical protein SAMD00019534_020340 [Acytostelium subglobosum LB1]GAM18859.1 hypothetical protein SAMD00019534_020340 [Acytostelium subglobosum LB1]|eukprot:XP_012758079.1 hypothetical protein SAMD00019534_020340 [Acytostelium subglobosum LB1]
MIRSLAPQNSLDILLTNDQQLVDELLPMGEWQKDHHTPLESVTSEQLRFDTVHQLWEQIERLTKYGLIPPMSDSVKQQAKVALRDSKDNTIALIGDGRDGDDKMAAAFSMSDEQRMVYVNLLKHPKVSLDHLVNHILMQYCSTGDCALLHFFMVTIPQLYCMFNNIVEHGTLLQAQVAMGIVEMLPDEMTLYTFDGMTQLSLFTDQDDTGVKLEILKHLNTFNVTLGPPPNGMNYQVLAKLVFDVPMDTINFLISNDNKILPLDQFGCLFIDHHIFERVYSNKPEIIDISFQMRVAVQLGDIRMMEMILERDPTILDDVEFVSSQVLNLSITNRPHIQMLQWLLEHLKSTPLNNYHFWVWVGLSGDIDLLDLAMKHFKPDTPNLHLMLVSAMEDFIVSGNLEMMNFIFKLDPLEIDYEYFEECLKGDTVRDRMDNITKIILSIFQETGNTIRMERLLSCMDDEMKSKFKTVVIPNFTKDLIEKPDVVMLRYLVDNGAKLNLNGVSLLPGFKSSAPIRTVIRLYQDKQKK